MSRLEMFVKQPLAHLTGETEEFINSKWTCVEEVYNFNEKIEIFKAREEEREKVLAKWSVMWLK